MPVSSPFKFLNAYTKEDKDIFFGREEEVEQLYQLVFQTNLTLVYGQSGTGKTSLVECGLANRFAISDWFNIYIRRHENINQSLLRTLRNYKTEEPGSSGLEGRIKRRGQTRRAGRARENPTKEPVRALRRVYEYFFRPVYLIFDQFEELFILGKEAEQAQFYETIADILETETYCRVIIIMREEVIARLYDFEKIVPSLFEKRMRVEPMSQAKAREVVRKTTQKFGITLAGENVDGAIVDVISKGEGLVDLPHLQVFMDKLYRETTSPSSGKVVFAHALIERFDDIDNVLAEFLQSQTREIEQLVRSQFPKVPESAVRKVFGRLVTLKGTKRPLARHEIIAGPEEEDSAGFILKKLQERRLVRYVNGFYEPAHDTLAQQFNEQRSEEELALLQVSKLAQDRLQSYPTARTLLSNNELALVRNYQAKLREDKRLTEEEWSFIRKSIRYNNRRRFAIWSIVLVIVASLAMLAGNLNKKATALEITQQQARNEAEKAKKLLEQFQKEKEEKERAQQETNNEQYSRILEKGKRFIDNGDFERAITEFDKALAIRPNGVEADSLKAIARESVGLKESFGRYIQEGDNYAARADTFLIYAREEYRKALRLGFDNEQARNELQLIEPKLDQLFDKYKKSGDYIAGAISDSRDVAASCDIALKRYLIAARIRPGEKSIQRKIDELMRKCSSLD